MNKNDTALQAYYDHVQLKGSLPTRSHAERWSGAILRTMGYNMPGSAKKKLAAELPAELAGSLTRGFKLVPFINGHMTADDFYREVAGRSGNTDPAFAQTVTAAAFSGLKQMIDADLSRQVRNALPREIGPIWDAA